LPRRSVARCKPYQRGTKVALAGAIWLVTAINRAPSPPTPKGGRGRG
jgi:hypothetical protein